MLILASYLHFIMYQLRRCKMKKFLISVILLGNLIANPIPIPQARISELYFNEQDNWILELDIYYETPYQAGMFDSIFISSTSGIAKIKPDIFREDEYFFIVKSDSLLTPLFINPEGDCIKVYTHINYMDESLIDSLIFGNYPGSFIPDILEGYSICRLELESFARDKSPTLGAPNDTTGTCGTLTGFIYDIENELIPKGNFYLDSDLYFDDTGKFNTRIYSLTYGKTYLRELLSPTQSNHIIIDTLKINLEPDSTYHQNIHLHTDYVVGINEKKHNPEEELLLINYPNPFNAITTFKIKWPANLSNIEKRILIFNVTGQLINVIKLNDQQTVTWDGRNQYGNVLSSGTYFYKLVARNTVYKSGSMILLK